MNGKNILVFSPHADDAEVSMGGTIQKLTQSGHSVTLVVCVIPTERRDGRFDGEFEKVRKKAQQNAALDLGVNVEILGLDQYTISFNRDLVKLLDKKIQQYKPNIIFTQWNHDSHQDHQAVADATFAAARKNDTTVLMYEQLTLGGITPYSFKSHIYVDITDSIDSKLQSVDRYVPDTLKESDVEAVRALARFRGNQIGVDYAECFEVCKVISGIDDNGIFI